MPNFDGTGPKGKGPFTGRGKGYCIIKIGDFNDTGKGVADMPRGDGTGPMGLGPMTGRGAGYCAGYSMPGYINPIPGRGYSGRGVGYFGRGAGRGRRNWYYSTGLAGWQRSAMGLPAFGSAINPNNTEITPKEEMDILKNEADFLRKQLEDIQNRIEGLEKIQSKAV